MLTPDQIAQYHEEGYTVLHEFLSRAAVDAILADIEALTSTATVAHHDSSRLEMEPNQGPEGRKVRRIYEPCTYYPRFRALSESKDLLDVIEQLIGPNLVFHLSKVNMKPAALGSVVDWHQDLTYYPLDQHRFGHGALLPGGCGRLKRLFAGYSPRPAKSYGPHLEGDFPRPRHRDSRCLESGISGSKGGKLRSSCIA